MLPLHYQAVKPPLQAGGGSILSIRHLPKPILRFFRNERFFGVATRISGWLSKKRMQSGPAVERRSPSDAPRRCPRSGGSPRMRLFRFDFEHPHRDVNIPVLVEWIFLDVP